MGKWIVGGLLVIIVASVAYLGYRITRTSPPQPSPVAEVLHFRNVVYPAGASETQFPGSGEIKTAVGKRWVLIPKSHELADYKEVPYTSDDQAAVFRSEGYSNDNLDAYDNYLLYTVGKFHSFANINKSTDKALILTDPGDTGRSFTFRLSRTATHGQENNSVLTQMQIEKSDAGVNPNHLNSLTAYKNLDQLSDAELDKIFKFGDIVIVQHLPPYPGIIYIDKENRMLYAKIITIRRESGVADEP